jgi:hypothetical protein
MSKEDFNILPQYLDVYTWLLDMAFHFNTKFIEMIALAIKETANHFNLPYNEIEELVTRRELAQSKEEVPIVTFYLEYLRKIRDSHQ